MLNTTTKTIIDEIKNAAKKGFPINSNDFLQRLLSNAQQNLTEEQVQSFYEYKTNLLYLYYPYLNIVLTLFRNLSQDVDMIQFRNSYFSLSDLLEQDNIDSFMTSFMRLLNENNVTKEKKEWKEIKEWENERIKGYFDKLLLRQSKLNQKEINEEKQEEATKGKEEKDEVCEMNETKEDNETNVVDNMFLKIRPSLELDSIDIGLVEKNINNKIKVMESITSKNFTDEQTNKIKDV